MNKKNFDSEKKLEIRLCDVTEKKKKMLIRRFRRNPTLILNMDGEEFRTEGLVKRDDSVYYMGTKDDMSINNLQTGNNY